MNAALEWLFMIKAIMDSHQKDLALNTDIARHENEAWTTKAPKEVEVCFAVAIKEVEAHSVIHACALEKSHKESMLGLECEVIAEEGCNC